MTAAHGGYNSEEVPLGGGAAVCERLCRHWQGERLTLIGSGPQAPVGVEYLRVGGLDQLPSSLNEWEYAAFCRRFEREASQSILAMRPAPVVLSHDISESPNFYQLTRAGVECLSVLHVDVVDYFQRFYLGDLLPVGFWSWLHRWTRQLPWPDVLQLVFEKQYRAAKHCRNLIVPSQPMAHLLAQAYPDLPQGRVQVVPWGCPSEVPAGVEAAKVRLRQQWGAGPILLTLSRIAPEKSQDLLLRALLSCPQLPSGLTVVIVGGPSYMQGRRYLAQLQALAAQLSGVRVVFPGHLGGADKRAALELADVFCVCSRHESYGLTIMEALEAGCPVAAMRSYGVDATLDSSCARLVEPGSGAPQRLGRVLLDLLADPTLRAQMGQAARARAAGQGFQVAADRLLQLCQGSRAARRGVL